MRPHHYPQLLARWRSLARRAGLRLRPLGRAGLYPLVYLQTRALREEGGIYLSAGVHGDEPAGTEGLLTWAELNVARLRDLPLLLFPCVNPWGLMHNTRTDQAGNDLNRSFHRRISVIRAMRKIVGRRRFAASLHLHEDYDGEGFYLYELARGEGWGERLLHAAQQFIPIDPRVRIDRWHAKDGLIRRVPPRKRFETVGYPEAIWLFCEHTDHAITTETPSEFALHQRVAAQAAVLDEVVRRAR